MTKKVWFAMYGSNDQELLACKDPKKSKQKTNQPTQD